MDKKEYVAYLGTKEWKQKRKEALKLAGDRCQICNEKAGDEPLQVHHRTYERVGNELPADLTVLCHDCHGLISTGGRLVRQISALANSVAEAIDCAEDSLAGFRQHGRRTSIQHARAHLESFAADRFFLGLLIELRLMFSHLDDIEAAGSEDLG